MANPPFSVKTWRYGVDFSYGRFDGFDVPPDKNGDYAFLLHMIKSMRPRGKDVVMLPHGVLFRGNAEARIRTELLDALIARQKEDAADYMTSSSRVRNTGGPMPVSGK